MRSLRNIIRALKCNHKKHIPVHEFIGGVEDRLGRTLDQESRSWLKRNPILVDLLHQMLTGRLVAGNDDVDKGIWFLFFDKMVFSRSNIQRADLDGDEAWLNIMEKFSETHPDAGMLVSYAFNAFVTKHEGDP